MPLQSRGKTNASRLRELSFGALLTLIVFGVRAGVPPTIPISQTPLTVVIPLHPQVLLAIGNSQSMDGDLSGAILTGSGVLPGGLVSLTASSSPTQFAVPAGFTPPLNPGSGGFAPYTVASGGVLYDNGASRLNVAKQGIQAILQSYMVSTDFGLLDYATSAPALYTTWVYQMSPNGGFTFTNSPQAGLRYVSNPCYQYTSASNTVKNNCSSMAGLYGSATLANNQYMQVSSSSDDADINDVLYAGGLPGVFVSYNGPHPASPFPPNFTLANYNNGGILIGYNSTTPNIGGFATAPTNAGFVPFSTQVLYAQRGFGYFSNQQPDTGQVVVPMTSAGQQPTNTSLQTALTAFAASLQPETNNLNSGEIKALAVQSPLAGLLSKAKSYLQGLPKQSGSCQPQQYVVLITDGLPTQDLDGNAWPPLGSASAQGYGVTAGFNADGSLGPTNDQALQDTVNVLGQLKAAGIKTFVVGLGAGVNPSLNPSAAATLKAMAVAGGTGNFFPATSPQALVDDLNTILIAVQSGSLSTAAAAVNSTGLNTNSVVYQAVFTVSDTPYQDWTGDLLAFPIAGNGQVNTNPSGALWDASTQLDALAAGGGWNTGRVITTWNPAAGNGAGAGAPFRWASLSATQQAQLQPSDALGSLRLDYLRGDPSREKRNGGAFRNRSHVLGDIVDSAPVFIAAPNGPFPDASYLAFEQANSSRPATLYVGANDGMLHALDPTTGGEKFAFVPDGVFGKLIDLTDPLYNSNHQFFVDGSPQAGDVQFIDGSWHTLLVGGENGGGNTVYALDVTAPQNLTSEAAVAGAVLWEFSDPDMGLSYSTPAIARITPANSNAPGFAVFFGNGYNSPSGHAILYAVNPQNGQIITKIDLCLAVPTACNPALPNGLSGVVAGNSSGFLGGPVDHVFAGDLQGNLWSVNVSNSNPSKWTVRLLFQARDGSGNPQPITTTPVISLNPNIPNQPGLMVFFGTGRLLANADLTNTSIQSFYGVWDKPSSTQLTTSIPPFTRANLQAQTLTTLDPAATGLPNPVRTATSNPVNWSTQVGWFFDLPAAGERSITDPRIADGGVVFSTYAPAGNTCAAGGTSFLMDVNFATGGSFDKPQIDVNSSFSIDSGDQVVVNNQRQNPVGLGLGQVYATAPTIISANLGLARAVKLVTKSNRTIQSVQEAGGQPHRSGWWQLQ